MNCLHGARHLCLVLACWCPHARSTFYVQGWHCACSSDPKAYVSMVSVSAVVAVQGSTAVQAPLQVAGQEWLVTCVSMGNPHAVVFGTKQGNLKVGFCCYMPQALLHIHWFIPVMLCLLYSSIPVCRPFHSAMLLASYLLMFWNTSRRLLLLLSASSSATDPDTRD